MLTGSGLSRLYSSNVFLNQMNSNWLAPNATPIPAIATTQTFVLLNRHQSKINTGGKTNKKVGALPTKFIRGMRPTSSVNADMNSSQAKAKLVASTLNQGIACLSVVGCAKTVTTPPLHCENLCRCKNPINLWRYQTRLPH